MAIAAYQKHFYNDMVCVETSTNCCLLLVITKESLVTQKIGGERGRVRSPRSASTA